MTMIVDVMGTVQTKRLLTTARTIETTKNGYNEVGGDEVGRNKMFMDNGGSNDDVNEDDDDGRKKRCADNGDDDSSSYNDDDDDGR